MLLYFFAEFWSILSLSDNCSIGEDLSYWWKLGTKDVSFFCLQRFKERWEVPSSWIEILLSQCGSVITLRRFLLFLYWCVSVSERMSLPNDHNFWFISFEHLALGTIDKCFDINKYAFTLQPVMHFTNIFGTPVLLCANQGRYRIIFVPASCRENLMLTIKLMATRGYCESWLCKNFQSVRATTYNASLNWHIYHNSERNSKCC